MLIGKGFYCGYCPSCGKWQGFEVRKDIQSKKFTCVYCRKSRTLKYKNEIGLQIKVHGPYENPRVIPKLVEELNAK